MTDATLPEQQPEYDVHGSVVNCTHGRDCDDPIRQEKATI